MQKIIGVTELQRRFRLVFDEVARDSVPYVLTRGSRPEVAMIPYDEYLRFQILQEKEILARFDALTERMAARNAEFTDAGVEADIEAARAEVIRGWHPYLLAIRDKVGLTDGDLEGVPTRIGVGSTRKPIMAESIRL